mgnify:CR=1 FL=1
MNINEKLIDLSIKCNGDYFKMIKMIEDKEIAKKTIDDYTGIYAINLLDENYPELFKKAENPPILIYSNYNDLSILNKKLLNKDTDKIMIIGSDFQLKQESEIILGQTLPEYEKNTIDDIINDLVKESKDATILGYVENRASRYALLRASICGLNVVAYSSKSKEAACTDCNIFYDDDPFNSKNEERYKDAVLLTEKFQSNKDDKLQLKDVSFAANRLCAMTNTLIITGGQKEKEMYYKEFTKYAELYNKFLMTIPYQYHKDEQNICNDLIADGVDIYNGPKSLPLNKNIIKNKEMYLEI